MTKLTERDKNKIGDGKLPNYYWVFHYDEKLTRKDGELIYEDEAKETKGGLIGKFKTYKEAIKCVNERAYLTHVIIEDRLSGQVFEAVVVICSCCGKEDSEVYEDIKYTKETMEKMGVKFE
jgi:hypothetical protein